MASYQCSRCGNLLSSPKGKCPKCGANLFLKEPIYPAVKQLGQDVPCKGCKINMESSAFVCPNCGTMRWSKAAATLGLSGFLAIFWIAALGLLLYSKSQGNTTASGFIIAGCGLVNLAVWGTAIYFALKVLQAFNTRARILTQNAGVPYVELKPVTGTPARASAEPVPAQSKPTAAVSSSEAIRQTMLQAEKDALNIRDFDEAAKALTELYTDWIYNQAKYASLVGGLNYIEGKKDGCFCVNQYLKGNQEYDAVHLRHLMGYHEGFAGDVFHRGALEIIRWGYERTITDLKVRGG